MYKIRAVESTEIYSKYFYSIIDFRCSMENYLNSTIFILDGSTKQELLKCIFSILKYMSENKDQKINIDTSTYLKKINTIQVDIALSLTMERTNTSLHFDELNILFDKYIQKYTDLFNIIKNNIKDKDPSDKIKNSIKNFIKQEHTELYNKIDEFISDTTKKESLNEINNIIDNIIKQEKLCLCNILLFNVFMEFISMTNNVPISFLHKFGIESTMNIVLGKVIFINDNQKKFVKENSEVFSGIMKICQKSR